MSYNSVTPIRKPDELLQNGGLCTIHKFEDAEAGLINPAWSRDCIMPVEYCVHCGTLRVKLKEKKESPLYRVRKMCKKT